MFKNKKLVILLIRMNVKVSEKPSHRTKKLCSVARPLWRGVAGFTILEMLVVMISIGILVAIAMPHYQKIIWRSRHAEVVQAIYLIARAEHVYRLAHGQYTLNDLGNCVVGNGVPTGSTGVQQDLGIEVSENSIFQYLVYPTTWNGFTWVTSIYYRQPPYDWSWAYDYNAENWWDYDSGACPVVSCAGPTHRYFDPPD